MILLDSDVLVLDLRYPNDPRFTENRQALQRSQGVPGGAGIMVQALLEVVGILSFSTSPGNIPFLPDDLLMQYGLSPLPDPQRHPDFAGCTVPELVTQMSRQMSLPDAIQAVQIARFASFADCLLTWNARHFTGKLAVPALTPRDWLSQTAGGTP